MGNPLIVEFHSEARSEADASFANYMERNRSVAELFYLELEAALKQIQDNYECWPAYLHGTRRYLLKRFPFVIVYRVGESKIEIVAVAHGRRKPGYWTARVR